MTAAAGLASWAFQAAATHAAMALASKKSAETAAQAGQAAD